MLTKSEWLKKYRAENPRSRAEGPFRYCHNTGSSKRKQCLVCGQKGPSWSAQWPKTRRAERWEDEHLMEHFHAED